jgi:hypothetical protein
MQLRWLDRMCCLSPIASLQSGCVGMCVNLCKAPTQTFFTEQLGEWARCPSLPLHHLPAPLLQAGQHLSTKHQRGKLQFHVVFMPRLQACH